MESKLSMEFKIDPELFKRFVGFDVYGQEPRQALVAALAETQMVAALPPHPVWRREEGQLWFRGELRKTIKNLRQASNAMLVLDSFQELGWPARIDDPLPGSADGPDRRDRLKETCDSLNSNLDGLHFRRGGDGESIVWESTI